MKKQEYKKVDLHSDSPRLNTARCSESESGERDEKHAAVHPAVRVQPVQPVRCNIESKRKLHRPANRGLE